MGDIVKCANHLCCGNNQKLDDLNRPISSWCESCLFMTDEERFYVIGFTDAWKVRPGDISRLNLKAYRQGVNDREGIFNECMNV